MFLKSYKLCYTVCLIIVAVILVSVQAQSSCTTKDRKRGSCVPAKQCPAIKDALTQTPIPPSVIQLVQESYCGTFNNEHYMCCDQSNSGGSTIPSASQPTSAKDTIRPSVDKTESEMQTGMAILQGTKCGKSDGDRVANGEDANLAEYPWMALLMYDDGVTKSLDCGGSLISDQYVLTAAHCIRVSNKKLIRVRLGEHDLKQETDCEGFGKARKCSPPTQEIDVEEAIYHKNYSPSKFSDDIGIIRLAQKAVIRSNVRPICLPITPNSQSVALNRMIIAGWGRIENGFRASVLQKAVVPVKDNDFCQRIHKLIRISDTQLCAGGESEVDTCKGDSGGPLFMSARYRLGARYIQYGVVSAGSTLCGSNFPGIYTKVISYLPWITGNIRQ